MKIVSPSSGQNEHYDDSAARALVQAAQARVYKWPPTFPGYYAALTVNDDGILYEGEVLVRPTPQVIVSLGRNEPLSEWVREQLRSQVRHFAYTSFAASDGRYRMTFARDDEEETAQPPRGRRIILYGGPMQSWYRIKDERYTQISRTVPGVYRRLNTIERHESAPDRRLYATHYVLTYFSEQTDMLIKVESYVDECTRFDTLLLPTQRSVTSITQGTVTTRILTLTTYTLLD